MNIFKQFCEDNTAVWLNNEGQARNPEQIFAKDLLSYIRHLDELENRPTETIMWIERSGEEPKLQLVFDEFRIKIEQNSSQSFIRVLGKPWCCRDSREEECGHAASGDPAVRKVINKIFACFYLDRNCQGSVAKNYNWNVFLQNDGTPADQFKECEYMIRQSFLQEHENDQSCPDLGAEELLFGLSQDVKNKIANSFEESLAKGNVGTVIKKYTKKVPDVFVFNKKTAYETIFTSADNVFDFFASAAGEIVEEVNQQPLMYYLSRKGSKYAAEYRAIVNHTVRYKYEDGQPPEIKVSAPIGTLHANFRSKILRYAEKKTFSAHDVMVFLGKLAEKASENDKNGYMIDEKTVRDVVGEMSLPPDVITDLMEEGFLVKTRRDNKLFYKFSLKQTRLVALAELHADRYNEDLAKDPNDLARITDEILNELLGFSEENRIIDHTKFSFDTVIVYAEILRICLDFLISRRVSDCLISMAQKFEVSLRMQQEKAIALLTYELCEHGNHFLPTKRMNDLFLSTYGKNAYKAQIVAWPYLCSSSEIYREGMEMVCENACTLGENGYSLTDPFFIFYYGYLFDGDEKEGAIDTAEAFFRQSCILQSNNWKNILENRLELLELSKHKELFDFLKKYPLSGQITSESPKIAIGLNMLLYSAFDVLRAEKNLTISDLYGENSRDARKHMNKLILFTDYMTRSLSEEYNELFCRDKEGADINSVSMFLPCGAVRLTSVKKMLDDFDPDLRYRLNDPNMVARYQVYLSHTCGRNRILLIRLLALVSTYFDDNDLPLDIKDFEDIQFLDYDGISRRQLNDLRNCLDENGDKKDKKDRIIKILLNIKN